MEEVGRGKDRSRSKKKGSVMGKTTREVEKEDIFVSDMTEERELEVEFQIGYDRGSKKEKGGSCSEGKRNS